MRAWTIFGMLAIAVLCAFGWPTASAQARPEVFVVRDIAVDATAANAAAAQTAALGQGRAAAFQQLVRRIGLPEDVAARGIPAVAGAQLDRLISGVDVSNERRSGVRYLASLSVRFDPSAVRALLRQSGIRFVDTGTPPVLVVARANGGPAGTADRWRAAWRNAGYEQALVPLVAGTDGGGAVPDWAAVESTARQVGATTALFVTARFDASGSVVEVIEIGPRELRRDRGLVNLAPIAGDTDFSRAMPALVREVAERLQTDWKVTALSRSGERGRVQLTARYESLSQWIQMRRALGSSPLASDIRTDAVARDGALLSIRTAGTVEQLREDLEQRGLAVSEEAGGLVARLR
jgi:hypothetical protein